MEVKEYPFAHMGQVMSELIDGLSKIFIMIALEISPCACACAKSLLRSQYTDTKLKKLGEMPGDTCQLLELLCKCF